MPTAVTGLGRVNLDGHPSANTAAAAAVASGRGMAATAGPAAIAAAYGPGAGPPPSSSNCFSTDADSSSADASDPRQETGLAGIASRLWASWGFSCIETTRRVSVTDRIETTEVGQKDEQIIVSSWTLQPPEVVGMASDRTTLTMNGEEKLFPSRPCVLPDEMKGLLLLPSGTESELSQDELESFDASRRSASSNQDLPFANALNSERDLQEFEDPRTPSGSAVAELAKVFGQGMTAGLLGGCLPQRMAQPPTDMLLVEGHDPIQCAPFQWTKRLVAARNGLLFEETALYLDPNNPKGQYPWSSEAAGHIVIVDRSSLSLEELAANAEIAGVAGLLVLESEMEVLDPEISCGTEASSDVPVWTVSRLYLPSLRPAAHSRALASMRRR